MLITKETDYALRILRALAGGERLSALHLAENEQVPRQFAYKILKKLERAGFVSIVRGAGGGFVLAAPLHSVSLYRLILAMEREALLTACTRPGYRCQWRESHGGAVCHAHVQLAGIQERINHELDSHSLQEILFGA